MEALRRSVVMPWGPRDSCDLPSISNPAAPHDGPSFRTSETHHPFATSGTTEGHAGFQNPVPICEGYMLSFTHDTAETCPLPMRGSVGVGKFSCRHKVSRAPQAFSSFGNRIPSGVFVNSTTNKEYFTGVRTLLN